MAVAYLTGNAGQFVLEIGPESVKTSRQLELIAAPVWGQQIKAQEFGNVTGRSLSVTNVEVNRYKSGCGAINSVIQGVERLMRLQGRNGTPSVLSFLYGGRRFGPAALVSLQIEEYLWRRGVLTNARVSFELLELPRN